MVYLVFATLFSGLTFFFVKIIATRIYPLLGNLLSISVAIIVQLLIFSYLRWKGVEMNLTSSGAVLSLVAGLFVAFYTVFLYFAFSQLDVSKATPILYLGSLAIVTILGVVFLKESLTFLNILGLLLAAGSIVLLLQK